MDQAREQYARKLVLRWPRDGRNGDGRKLLAAIEQALRSSRGGKCSVAVRYAGDDAAALVQFGEEWTVRPSRELVERLGQIVGREGVELFYAPRVDG